MTRVAVITAATNTIERFRIDMIDEFVRRGCEVLILGDESEGDWTEYFRSHGVRYRSYPVSRNGMNPVRDLGTLRALTRILSEEKVDKVFTYQAKPNIYGGIAAHRAGSELFVMMGGLGSVFRPASAKDGLVRDIVAMEYRLSLKHADAVFFQNREDVETFKDLGIVRDEQVVMIHGSGVNLERFPAEPLPDKPSFLFVGRLVRGKGVMDYLDAARIVKRSHPEVGFVLVGPFDTNPTALKPEDLQLYIEDGTVRYEGERHPDEIHEYMKACSCFVLPSYYGEGTPKSALEAMATGRPLIVADAVGCREVVYNGENGFLVPPRDPDAIAHAMARLIEDPCLAERMGKASRCMAEEVFDVCRVNRTICEMIGL
ncbi:glycosyltransferase family 4 protein [Thermophilibacter sp.]